MLWRHRQIARGKVVNFARKKLDGRLSNLMLLNRIDQILQKYDIDCIIDVGANIGSYVQMLSPLQFDGFFISFEPDPEAFKELQINAAPHPKWLTRQYALGNENTMLSLKIMKSNVFNSFLPPRTSSSKYFGDLNTISQEITVPVRRLDDVLTELKSIYGFRRIFLKMDTQGFDLEVFKGCTKLLELIVGVQCEVPTEYIYENMPDITEYFDTFRSSGYVISGIYPVHETRFPSPIEFDVVFVKE